VVPVVRGQREGGGNAERRIIDATIRCIEVEGLEAVTTRRVAELAGVNSAAINYYFRSKEILLQKALGVTVGNSVGHWELIIADKSAPLEGRLRSILREMLEGTRGYPNLVKANVYGPLMEGNYETEFSRRFRRFTVQVRELAAPLFRGLADREIEHRVMALFAAALLPGLLGGFFSDVPAGGLGDSEAQASYVDLLIRQFLLGKGRDT
jgi:AcrR family transcriptional regulator